MSRDAFLKENLVLTGRWVSSLLLHGCVCVCCMFLYVHVCECASMCDYLSVYLTKYVLVCAHVYTCV